MVRKTKPRDLALAASGATRSAVGRSRQRRHGSPEQRVRDRAVSLLERSERSLSPVDESLRLAMESLESRDRGLLQELVLGTVRWRRRLDEVLEQVADRQVGDIDSPLRWPFRVALYQLFFLDRMPPHAVVNEAVEQARRATHRGGASFVNAVLRKVARKRDLAAWPVRSEHPIERLAIETSHPDFLVERWVAHYGEETTRKILETNNRVKPLHLLAFRDRGGRERVAERLIDEDVAVDPSCLSPCGLIVRSGRALQTEAFANGAFYVQDEASQVAALVPPPRVGERILDVAAAPGGKTFALSAYEPLLDITAADVSISRLARMRSNAMRLDRESLRLVACDGLRLALGGEFERVVVDTPCSGTGTLRKNPELKWRLQPSELEQLMARSRALAESAAGAVAPGGLLVLIACSIELEEVTGALEHVLEKCGDFAPEDLSAYDEYFVRRGLQERAGLWQLLPSGDHDGFSVAVARRRGQ